MGECEGRGKGGKRTGRGEWDGGGGGDGAGGEGGEGRRGGKERRGMSQGSPGGSPRNQNQQSGLTATAFKCAIEAGEHNAGLAVLTILENFSNDASSTSRTRNTSQIYNSDAAVAARR